MNVLPPTSTDGARGRELLTPPTTGDQQNGAGGTDLQRRGVRGPRVYCADYRCSRRSDLVQPLLKSGLFLSSIGALRRHGIRQLSEERSTRSEKILSVLPSPEKVVSLRGWGKQIKKKAG